MNNAKTPQRLPSPLGTHRSHRARFTDLVAVTPRSLLRFVGAALAVILLSGVLASAESTAEVANLTSRSTTSPLTVVALPTPRFHVPRYDTSGTYPQVRDGALDLRAVNVSLHAAVLADQRAYAPHARMSVVAAGDACRGIYQTSIDRRLISASSVVVSALLPATKLYPCGNEGKTWLAVTVQVPGGQRISVSDLFLDPSRGLRVLATSWLAQVRRTEPAVWPCVAKNLAAYRPSARAYRNFALTPNGLAVGFWQAPACSRLQGTVPYTMLRRYLSPSAIKLIAGVRAPR